ncbi:hypothetical protein SASPL_130216 [Salvia splendens]|uniref:GBF-interacting protein 1 N-terminal domain-containing protein n=1 Tax=Salvia splendens TaxID=180675 RepID=A0A8X8X5L4_SALSN|nr:hypothetical protein SASPL_130216 [Salvia splendens]
MSTARESGAAGNGGGLQSIPAASRKIVQSLKEIVNCTEAEIYAALKECNMDPDDAVSRLLSQGCDFCAICGFLSSKLHLDSHALACAFWDLILCFVDMIGWIVVVVSAVDYLMTYPFHEVKSKREKKKEGKDTTEARSRGANNNTGRSGKTGADRYRGGSTPYYSSESVTLVGKTTYKKEDGSVSSISATSSTNRSRVSTGPRHVNRFIRINGTTAENKGFSDGAAEAAPSGVQQASGYQSAWAGARGQVSMADIVKMGRPQNKTSHSQNASHHNDLRFPADYSSKDYESGTSPAQHIPTNEEWPAMEKPTATHVQPEPYYAVDSELHLEPSGITSVSVNQLPEAEVVQEEDEEDEYTENYGADAAQSDSITNVKFLEDDSRGASLYENDLYKDMGSFQHHAPHDFHKDTYGIYQVRVISDTLILAQRLIMRFDISLSWSNEDIEVSVSSVTRDLQQLNVEKDDGGLPSEEYITPTVVIPDHLQVQNADCLNLSFGSFGSAMGAAYSSGTVKPLPVETNLEEERSDANIPSVGHIDSRSTDYYVDDSLRNASDSGLFHRSSAASRDYDPSSASQQEELKPENAEGAHGSQYAFPPSNSGYTYDDDEQLNATFNQTSPHAQNLASYSDVMSYTNALPSNLTPANQPTRESDLRYSPFPVNQSMTDKFGGSAISMSEALKTAGFTLSQPAPQTHSGTGIPTGPPPPPQQLVHPYTQPSVPLGPYANMIGYQYLPQMYLPSAFQQTFAGNSSYHQSLLSQYKNNVSSASLPQSAPGYGAFGNNTNAPGNFTTAAPSGTNNISYDDVLREQQYKDNLLSLQQQNENSAMWLHGLNSRTMSAVPASTYYNYQGQNQQSSGFRQAQQPPSQSYGALGYPNFYHSQSGASHDQPQQQNPRDVSSLQAQQQQQQPKQPQLW